MTPELERSKYMGVLLAAGHATRTGTLRDEFPKPILPIGNKPLLVHQIELLRSMGIIDITVLIGHKGYQITRVLGDGERHGVRLQFVEQKSMLGIAHALGQLENYVDRPFLLFLGDIVGKSGRDAVLQNLPMLRDRLAVDCVVANGENMAGGMGVTPETCEELFKAGRRDEILHYLGQRVVRDKAAGHEYRIGGNMLEIVKP